MAKRLGLKVGTQLAILVYKITYKNDDLADPIINEHHAIALGLSSYEELTEIHDIVARLNIDLYNNISNLPSTVFFYGLEKGQEIDVAIEDGKLLNICYTAVDRKSVV